MGEDVAVEPYGRVGVDDIGDDGGGNGDQRQPAVAYAAACEDAEEEHAEQRTVGIAGNKEDRLYHRVVIQHVYHRDAARHTQCHQRVDNAPQGVQRGSGLRVVGGGRSGEGCGLVCWRSGGRCGLVCWRSGEGCGLVCWQWCNGRPAAAEEVDSEGRGESGEGAAGSRIGGCDEAHHEQHAHYLREKVPRCQVGEDIIRLQRRDVHARPCGIGIEQVAQEKKQPDDHYLHARAEQDVLAALRGTTAGERALHHVLVDTRCADQEHDTRYELLPEIRPLLRVVEPEYPRHGVGADARKVVFARGASASENAIDAQSDGQREAYGLQQVGLQYRFHSAAERAEVHHRDGEQHIHPVGHTQRGAHKELEHFGDDEQPHARPEHLADEEEPCARAVGAHAEPLLQVAVDGREVVLVVERYKPVCQNELSDGEPRHHLHVTPSRCADHARHAHERNARHGGGHRGYTHQQPRALPAAREERAAVRLPSRYVRHGKQHAEIEQYDSEDESRRHGNVG